MGGINMLKQHRNTVMAGEFSDAEDCRIWIDGVEYLSYSCTAKTSYLEYLSKLQFTDVWEMGGINIYVETAQRNTVMTGEYSDAEDCRIWIDGIGCWQLYSQIITS